MKHEIMINIDNVPYMTAKQMDEIEDKLIEVLEKEKLSGWCGSSLTHNAKRVGRILPFEHSGNTI